MKKLFSILIILIGLFCPEWSAAQVHPNGVTVKKHLKLYECYIIVNDNDTLDMLVDSAKVAEMISILGGGGNADSAIWADTSGYSEKSETLNLPIPSDTVILIMYPDGRIDTAGYEMVEYNTALYTSDTRDSLITAYDSAHTHPNKSLLNAITQGDINNWDAAGVDMSYQINGGVFFERSDSFATSSAITITGGSSLVLGTSAALSFSGAGNFYTSGSTLYLTSLMNFSTNVHIQGNLTVDGTYPSDYGISDKQPFIWKYWKDSKRKEHLAAFEGKDRTDVQQYNAGNELANERTFRYLLNNWLFDYLQTLLIIILFILAYYLTK